MTKSRRTASTSPAQRITAAIVEKLEQGTNPPAQCFRRLRDIELLRACRDLARPSR